MTSKIDKANNDWRYFLGNNHPDNKFTKLEVFESDRQETNVDSSSVQNFQILKKLPESPEWRNFMPDKEFEKYQAESIERWKKIIEQAEKDVRGKERGESFRLEKSDDDVINAVNAAFHLRRPLLITGKAGTGKTSLAYAVAYELGLGSVLTWAINTRSTLKDALYQYDAIARLQDAQLLKKGEERKPVGNYIRLGPVGTAFLPSALPRVLLIDEIDKCDINLPNDLLNLFEEGRYEIPELVRETIYSEKRSSSAQVRTADDRAPATIIDGKVFCREFPLVVMTSNGEREFPPAFLRRCLRLRMPDPNQNPKALENIVKAHLTESKDEKSWQKIEKNVEILINNFIQRGEDETAEIATDQLLNVVYLLTREVRPDETTDKEGEKSERDKVAEILLRKLSEED